MLPPDQAALILDRGERAAELLATTCFTETINDLSDYHLAALVAAPPGPRGLEAREHHHLLHHAITEIVATLKSQVDTAERLRAALDEGDAEDM